MIRKLATIQTITKLEVHPNADKLDIAHVKGWGCVVNKDVFKENEKIIFVEPDAILPEGNPAWEFMRERGFRIKTIKLRKILSQGLVFKLDILPEREDKISWHLFQEGMDVTDVLKIQKYEPYVPANLSGTVKGNFPEFLHKTDEERVQNISRILEQYQGLEMYMTEKVDGCFLYKTYLPTWDGGSILIGDIVNKNLSPVLIGKDKQGNLVPTEIVKRFDNGTKDKWMKIYYKATHELKSGCRNQCMTVTPNHKIFTEHGELSASDVRMGDNLISYATSPDAFVLHMIESSLLGDGSITTKFGNGWKYVEGHQEGHKEYINYLQSWLGDCACPIDKRVSGFGSNMFRVSSKQYHSLSLLRKKWYPRGKKIIPQDLSWMDDFSIAKWYMDDGSLAHNTNKFQNDRALFATNGFSKAGVLRLGNRLKELYGIDFTVFYSKGWNLRVNYSNGSIHKLWTALTQYIIPCMRYKLPEEYRNISYFNPPLNYGKEILKDEYVPVTKIIKHVPVSKKKFPHGRKGFDIETTTHNYISNGILVHNSSMTVYLNNGEFGVCSRNLDLKETEDNTFWKTARTSRIEQALRGCGNYAIQGEILGRGIQSNKYNMADIEFRVFNVYDIDARKYLDFEDFKRFVAAVHLETVPMLGTIILNHTTDQILELVKGNSVLNKNALREGVVFRPLKETYDSYLGRLSFKGINSEFLLKYGE